MCHVYVAADVKYSVYVLFFLFGVAASGFAGLASSAARICLEHQHVSVSRQSFSDAGRALATNWGTRFSVIYLNQNLLRFPATLVCGQL